MYKKEQFKQFLVREGHFVPTTNTGSVQNIEPGTYELSSNMNGDIIFSPKTLVTDNFINMASMVTSNVINEIEEFWKGDTKQKFDKFGIVYKRGILMHGVPGTGKTSTIFQIINRVVELKGIAIYNPHPKLFSKAIEALRDIQGECRVVCVFEEFNQYCDSPDLLSLLDGELQVNNVVYIATTNYIDQIPDNLKKRPSRFARVIEVGKPDYDARLLYFTSKLPHLPEKDVQHMAKKTDNLVIDQLKDIIVNTECFGHSFKDALATVRSLGDKVFGLTSINEDVDDDSCEAREGYFRV